jgi:hypothetical protein
MNGTSAHIATLDQTDEDILTYTVSDEELEAAAGLVRGDTRMSYCTLRVDPCCNQLAVGVSERQITPHDR